MRDIVDYQMIAYESCLYNAALHRDELLRGAYKIAQRQVAKTAPWGFVVPAAQRDPGATRRLLELLRFGMVEVEKGRRWKRGDPHCNSPTAAGPRRCSSGSSIPTT